jgi:hypothetical protein
MEHLLADRNNKALLPARVHAAKAKSARYNPLA